MRALSDSDLIDLWENGVQRHPVDRALLTLGAAHPELPHAALADWPLGRRNRAIAELRGACFGHGIHGWIACPGCGDRLEFEIDWRSLADADSDSRPEQPIVVGGRTFRLPTSRDLAAMAQEADPHLAAIRLVDNCLVAPAGSVDWSEPELEQIGERMAEADPLAETRLTLDCPSCFHAWEESLDIATFLWEEIEARARRTVFEIHGLASAYGWTEPQILALSPSRRALYLQMVRT